MGIGMQIAYVGFSGTATLESEAALQLLRLQPYIGTIKNRARRIGRCIRDSAEAAIQCAFNIALRALEIFSLHCRL
ncbi:hypothetical protein [Paraburkholderia sacchari]|uniref:hypothetical protein n=1 Tax=Paraburkholderia sacchari TaxID=159450 RepID=UPI0005429C40|nr:hypothetical protein [Paraburkholderia sacchari]NLP63661.1 hypothetical protein [Paraburkholderia sacchari]